MTSVHLRRLESRRSRTADRIIDHAARESLPVADLRDVKLPWYAIRNAAGDSDDDDAATVLIYEEIGGSFGISAEQFARDLELITAPVIRLRINSPGGSVFDAIAIHNSLLHHPAKVVVYVDSLAASAASVITMAGDEIVMMPGSQLMIHDASAVLDGNAAEMRKVAMFLDRQSDNIADLYRMRGGGDIPEWRALMLAETWMFATEAVEMRLADRVMERDTPPGEEPTAAEPEEEEMGRAFDLSHFRYAGRSNAPAPARQPDRAGVTAGRRSHRVPPTQDGPASGPPTEPGEDQATTQFTRAYTEPTAQLAGEPMGTPVPFAASTPGVKRDGLDLRAGGWKVSNFDRNPVVLWAHNHTAPPIGRATATPADALLRMAVTFDQEDPFAVRLESKYRRGFLHAVSVGWDFVSAAGEPIAWWKLSAEQIRDKAFYDLTELSGVPVPSDPDALIERQRSALRHISRELVDLFDDMERPDGEATSPQVAQAVIDECVRLGIPLDLQHWQPITRGQPAPEDAPPAPAGVDHQAARSILAAFDFRVERT